MTIIMQIYLTVFLVLIVNAVVSRFIYVIFFKDSYYHETLELISGLWAIISTILPYLFAVYFILACIWHWY